jgi:hypothetical protein
VSTTHVLGIPSTFDIVLGDFGRDASIRFLELASLVERELIEAVLDPELEFFDEYRRIMYSTLLHIEYFKRAEIHEFAASKRPLDSSILIGLAGKTTSSGVHARILRSLLLGLHAGVLEGFTHFRVILPCNTLSALVTDFERIFADPTTLSEHIDVLGLSTVVRETLFNLDIEFLPLITTVASVLGRSGGPERNALILGTAETNRAYRVSLAAAGIRTVDLSEAQLSVIEGAVAASVGGVPARVADARDAVKHLVEECASHSNGLLTVIEACTDFRFGLGVDSLEIFARESVETWYGRFS